MQLLTDFKDRHLSSLAFILVFFCIVQTAIFIYLDSSIIHDTEYSVGLKFYFWGQELLFTLFTIAIFITPLFVLTALTKHTTYLIKLLIGVFVFLSICWVLSSWATQSVLGRFPGIEGIQMFLHQPLQIFKHALSFIDKPLYPSLILILFISLFFSYKTQYSRLTKVAIYTILVFFVFTSLLSQLAGPYYISTMSTALLGKTNLNNLRRTSIGPFSSLTMSSLAIFTLESANQLTSSERSRFKQASIHDETIELNCKPSCPDILVLVVESMRKDALAIYGGSPFVMPSLNSWLKGETAFNNAYASAGHSNYSDPAIFTSLYPLRDAVANDHPKSPNYPLLHLYDPLVSNGYKAAIFSAQNETWGDMNNALDSPSLDTYFHAGMYNRIKGLKLTDAGKFDDSVVADQYTQWLNQNTNFPTFAYLNLQTTHYPFKLPKDYQKIFTINPQVVTEAKQITAEKFGSTDQNKIDDVLEVFTKISNYFDALHYIDQQISKIKSTFQSRKNKRDLLLIVTADTGFEFGEHGSMGYGVILFEEVIKVPLVIKGIKLDKSNPNKIIEHIDIAPTILNELGASTIPSNFQGRPVSDESKMSHAVSVVQTPLGNSLSFRLGPLKLIYDYLLDEVYMYDLCTDLHENHNLWSKTDDISIGILNELQLWRKSQLSYYNNIKMQQSYFPPKLQDNLELADKIDKKFGCTQYPSSPLILEAYLNEAGQKLYGVYDPNNPINTKH